jgi:hypothetical protein
MSIVTGYTAATGPECRRLDADEQPAEAVSVHMSATTEGQLCGLANNIATPPVCER